MEVQVLLSALEPSQRKPLMDLLEVSQLRAILQLASGDRKSLTDRIIENDHVSSQIEITISHVHL